jgi:hypothetical protein
MGPSTQRGRNEEETDETAGRPASLAPVPDLKTGISLAEEFDIDVAHIECKALVMMLGIQ